MATRRENGMGSLLRRTQRNENSSPYKRRQSRRSPPPAKLQSSSSLSSFLSFLAIPFRRRAPESVPSPPPADSDDDDDGTDEEAPEVGVRRGRMIEQDNPAAETLSRLGQTLQQSIPKPQLPPPSAILPPADAAEMKASATTSQIAPLNRPRRTVQPAFATVSRTAGKRAPRPSFPGGNGSYGGFTAGTVEPSPPPFTPSNPLETSFAANRPTNSHQFSFTVPKPTIETRNLASKTSSEILAEFFASKGKAPLTPEERKKVAKLIAESDAESSQSPDADPYNGVPSFSFLKASFPPERNSISPSSSLAASESVPSTSGGLSFNFGSTSAQDVNQPFGSGPSSGTSLAPRRRRPINYGGSSKRSAAITKAGFTLREHQKLLEKQKARQQVMSENVAPDSSAVGDKRGVKDAEEDGGGKRRRMNDGQGAPVSEEPTKAAVNGTGVARVLSLSAQPSMPSPLRQMTKLNSPSPPRVVLRAQAPSPSSPLSRPASEDTTRSPLSTSTVTKTPTAARPKPRTSLVADVMRDMLAEDKEREKKEQVKEKVVDQSVFSNPYEDGVHQPIVAAPKVRKPRRTSARPAARSSATAAKQEAERPLSLIEKIEQTDVRPNSKKAKTEPEPPAPAPAFQPPTLTFTAPSPKETNPKARRPPPVVEEPVITTPTSSIDSDEIEIIDLDEDVSSTPKSKPAATNNTRPALSVEVKSQPQPQSNGSGMLGLPRHQRPSFSLHSPARPSPLREMSVPIEDEEDEIVEITVEKTNGFGSGGFGSGSAFGSAGSGFGSNGNAFGSTGNAFGSTGSGFGSTGNTVGSTGNAFGSAGNAFGSTATGFTGFGSTTNGTSSTLPPFGSGTSSGTFSAPVPPPAPTLAHAQLPGKKEAPKIQAPLFAPKSDVVAQPKPTPIVTPEVPKPDIVAPKPSIPVETPKPEATVPVIPAPVSSVTPAVPASEAELKASAQRAPISSLPTFSFTALVPSFKTPETPEARAASELPVTKLPTFTFGTAFAPAPVAKAASFDWAAAGMKAPSSGSGAQWTCGTCSLSNPASATEKCTICEAPRPKASAPAPAPAPAPVAKTASFDWGAAGMKAPTASVGGQWTCGMCGLSNPASATAKCTICEAPKPGAATSAPAPSAAPAPVAKTASFDWGAAGMKPPTSSGWTCTTCGLSNNEGAVKCTVCDASR